MSDKKKALLLELAEYWTDRSLLAGLSLPGYTRPGRTRWPTIGYMILDSTEYYNDERVTETKDHIQVVNNWYGMSFQEWVTTRAALLSVEELIERISSGKGFGYSHRLKIAERIREKLPTLAQAFEDSEDKEAYFAKRKHIKETRLSYLKERCLWPKKREAFLRAEERRAIRAQKKIQPSSY